MRTLYLLLLQLHPRLFRERFAEEMLWIFDQTSDGLEAIRLLGDAVVSLGRQWLLRRDQDHTDSHGVAALGAMPVVTASALPAVRILFSGALCSLLLFGTAGSIITRGGRQGFTTVPHAEAVRTKSLSFLAMAAPPQQPNEQADEPGSISGRVVDAVTGQPIVGATVRATGARMGISATTDAQGRYRLENVPMIVRGVAVSPAGSNLAGSKRISLASGEELKSVDFQLYPNASVSGVVADQNGETLEGIEVSFLRREYDMGGIRYVRTGISRTNDLGEYRLERSPFAGTAPALLWARRPQVALPAISDAPENPTMRRQAVESTYFPNGVRPEEGAVIRLTSGEQRENVNFQLRTSQSFCVEAQANFPGSFEEAYYQINTAHPGMASGRSSGLFSRTTPGLIGQDGRLRICDLARGEYRLMVYSGKSGTPSTMGSVLFAITDDDVKNLQVFAQPRTPIHGKTVWEAGSPAEPIDGTIYIDLARLHFGFGGGIRAQPQIPEEFRLEWTVSIGGDVDDPLMDEYRVDIGRMLESVYVKDVTYGGESVWHKPLLLGSKPAGAGLEVVLAHDGGMVRTRVVNDRGEPVGNATAVLIPKTAATHMELADSRLVGITNNRGETDLASVPPGEYWALAVEDNFADYAVETIAALFDARSRAEEIDIGPNATVDVELAVQRLER